MGHFGPENEVSSELWICSKDFFKTFHNKGGQEIYENYINGFSKKISFRAIGPFWAQKLHTVVTLDLLQQSF